MTKMGRKMGTFPFSIAAMILFLLCTDLRADKPKEEAKPLPEGRKNYTKTKPLRFDEFSDCLKWWNKRKENDSAWLVKAEDVLKYDQQGNLLSVNLDLKNPNAKEDLETTKKFGIWPPALRTSTL